MRSIHLPIAAPCHEDWDAMEPRERGKFCQRCAKDVHDLSSMTEDEAQEFLRQHAGSRICVNYRHDDAGRIQFKRNVVRAAAAAAVTATALAACTPHDRPREDPTPTIAVPDTRATQGEVAPEPPKPELPMTMGAVAPPPPEPTQMLRGDVAVPNEPCDPQPVEHALKGEAMPEPPPPVHAVKGKMKVRSSID